VVLKKQYNTSNVLTKKLLPGKDWYDIQAFRALNQSVGRCIRHRKDWGAIILLDSRYSKPMIQSSLSKWIRGRVQCFNKLQLAANSLKSFVTLASTVKPEENSALEVKKEEVTIDHPVDVKSELAIKKEEDLADVKHEPSMDFTNETSMINQEKQDIEEIKTGVKEEQSADGTTPYVTITPAVKQEAVD
jgi:hypothetical protein